MILAISGSLKRSSVNSAALRAAARAADGTGSPSTISDAVRRAAALRSRPRGAPPEPVLRFRAACASASGLLLAVPEYAFGIPGAFKNALDWTVGSGSLYRKPVGAARRGAARTRRTRRQALDHVLTALDVDVAHYAVPVGPNDRDASGEITERRDPSSSCWRPSQNSARRSAAR